MRDEIREYTIETGDRRRWYVCHARSIADAFRQIRIFEPSCALVVLESLPLTTKEG